MNSNLNLQPNQRQTLDLIRRNTPITRAELSRLSGLTAGALTRHCRDLLYMGLIREGDKSKGQRGQPSKPLMLNPRGGCSIGISFSLSQMDVTIIDLAGNEIISHTVDHDESKPIETTLALIKKVTKRIIKSNDLSHTRIIGIGYSVAGFLLKDGKRRRTVQELSHWREYNLPELFYNNLSHPTWVENNANASAIGEYYSGKWNKTTDLIYIDIGYGMGAGVIVNSKLISGIHGNAGEIGGFYRTNQPRPSMKSLIAELKVEGVIINEIKELELLEHPIVNNWIERSAEDLKIVLSSVSHWLDPEYIVIGGAVPKNILSKLIELLAWDRLYDNDEYCPPPKIRASKSGTQISSFGAAMIPIYKTFAPNEI